MNNKFDFNYFVPTPDTTANCALSRWNDSLMGLSDFLKSYMSTRQSLEFGFSRSLNIKEILNLNLAPSAVKDEDGKNDYVINYRKFGDLKAYVCGFEIPIVDFLHPFLKMNWVHARLSHIDYDTISLENVTHVFNYKSNLDQSARVDATLESLTSLRNDIENVMTDTEIAVYFNQNFDGTSQTRSSVLSMIDTAISAIQNMPSNAKDFIFGYSSKENLENEITSEVSGVYPSNPLSSTNAYLYKDLCYVALFNYPSKNFQLRIDFTESDYILSKYFRPNGIDLVFDNETSSPITYIGENKKQILIYFRFNMTEKPTITPFISHDGTEVPLSKQEVSIRWSKHTSGQSYNGMYQLPSYWDEDLECPVYFDAEGNAQPMSLESNMDGMGGKDYSFWSSPVQKTENGYQFECCMPLAFYNEATGSYGNEYYATKAHDGIEIGQVMYRVPVAKRMRQNIEEAIVNTHLAKCLNDLVPATNENAEDDETVVLGGVVVDDFTDGLYTVTEKQDIATEREYGEVKITRVKDSDGEYNGVLDLMYHYSETGELTYNNMTMPETGRAIDMITLFDTLKKLGGGADIAGDSYFVVNGINKGDVNIVAESNNNASLNIKSDFNIFIEAEHEEYDANYDAYIALNEDGSISLRSSEENVSKTTVQLETSYIYMQAISWNDSSNYSRMEMDLDKIYMQIEQKKENITLTNDIRLLTFDDSNNNLGIRLVAQTSDSANNISYSRIHITDELINIYNKTYDSGIDIHDSIVIRSEGENDRIDDEYLYSIALNSEKGSIIMGKTGSDNEITTRNGGNSIDIITQEVADVDNTASESLYLSNDSPTWNVSLKKGNGNNNKCSIYLRKDGNDWNLSPSDGTSVDPCDLGIESLPWRNIYAENVLSYEVSSPKIVTNNGTNTDLDNVGIFNMHPRKIANTNTLAIPIGGIIAVNARGLYNNNISSRNAGDDVYINDTINVKVALFEGTTFKSGDLNICHGHYICLNAVDMSVPNNNDALLLLVRIE